MTIDITTLDMDLKKVGCEFSLAFVHGLLAASCCQATDDADWINVLFSKTAYKTEQKAMIKTLFLLKNDLDQALGDSQLAFDLLLDKHLPIAQQTLQTRDWISGFLLGIKRKKLTVSDTISQEFISDLTRLAAMPIPEAETEDNAADLTEIQTYCQIGVITLYLTQTKPAPR